MRIKICGITKPDQAKAIAQLGASALGFICAPESPRFISADQIRQIIEQLPQAEAGSFQVDRVGVFVNPTAAEVRETVAIAQLNVVQLHGNETPQFCQTLRAMLPTVEIIKALRVRNAETLTQMADYIGAIDTLLLDAYVPHASPGQYGGTGKTIDWAMLQQFRPACPWLLAGGLNSDNILDALSQMQPDGIDLSSGVELSPGNKDLGAIEQLFSRLQTVSGIQVF